MKAITLRNIPEGVARKIRAKARTDKTSMNRAVISILQENLEPRAAPRLVLHHDLDELAGCWSRQEADEFDSYLREQRQIDEGLWK